MIKVLVVERDPSLAWLYQEELEEAGFMVGVERGLWDAVAACRCSPPQVLVTDLESLADNSGYWMTRLRQVYRGPVVLITDAKKLPRHLDGLTVIPKTSDLGPLVASLRSHRAEILWSGATTGIC